MCWTRDPAELCLDAAASTGVIAYCCFSGGVIFTATVCGNEREFWIVIIGLDVGENLISFFFFLLHLRLVTELTSLCCNVEFLCSSCITNKKACYVRSFTDPARYVRNHLTDGSLNFEYGMAGLKNVSSVRKENAGK